MAIRFHLLVIACALLAGCAELSGHLGQPEGAPVRMGASVAEVRQALHTDADPQPRGAAREIDIKDRGVQVLFDASLRVSTVRLDAPWATPVMGVRIGDSEESLQPRLGLAKIIRAPDQTGYTYFPDSATMVTYVVSPQHRVQTIFLEH